MKILTARRKAVENSIFWALFAIAGCFLLWKCRYGFGNVDESFYLTVPYRLWMGDGLFSQEWHLSQMAGFLLLPFMAVYMLLSGGSTAGIILAFRYIFTCVQGLAAVFLYLRLKKFSWSGACIAALVFFLYAPFGIMALSYNSMGILCLTVSTVLLLTNTRGSKLEYALSGLFFAAAVLCCPYLAAVYFLYSLAVLIQKLRPFCGWEVLSGKCWLWLTCGIGALAVLFCGFVLSRASLSDIVAAFPVIMQDPEHASRSASYLIESYFRSIFIRNAHWQYIALGYAVLWLACKLDRKGRIPRGIFFILGAVLAAVMMLPFVTDNRYINFIMFPLNLFALFCCGLTKDKTVKKLLLTVWLPGILYSFCIHMASNQYFYAISSASAVSLVGSILIVVLTARELILPLSAKPLKALTAAALVCLMALQAGGLVSLRYTSVFWETSMEDQTVLMEAGPEKGLLVTPWRKQHYEGFLADTAPFREEEKAESVLYLSEYTWLYLAGEGIEMSPYSAWLAGVNENTVARLTAYYALNPEKLPQVVYAEKEYAEFARELCGQYGYESQTTAKGNLVFTLP